MNQPVPLRCGQPGDFAQVLAICHHAGFGDDAICQALGLTTLGDLYQVERSVRDFIAVERGPLAVLIRLFLLGMAVPRDQVEGAVGGSAGLALLERLGLVEGHPCLATVCLYPVAGLLIASDRIFNPDGTSYTPPSDLVYAAISPGTLQFLRVISRAPARAALDLCTGSGVAALLLSQTVERAVAVDITARSAHFARFNAGLNGRMNVEVLQSDLYRELGDRRFERIVAHPPYAPALAESQTWRDSGETGEFVLRKIVEGLPDRLLPGGSLYAVTMGLHVGSLSFEDRIRQWLGQAQSEFDLIFAVDRNWNLRQLAVDLAVRSESGESARIQRWEQHLAGLGVVGAAYGALAIHRHGSDRAPLTLRTRLSDTTDHLAFDQTFTRHAWLSETEAGSIVSTAAPSLSPHLQIKVTHSVSNGNLVPQEFLLHIDQPFRSTIRLEPWMLAVVARCDGGRSTADLYREARAQGGMPSDFGLSDFAGLIALLILKGCLKADGL